MNSGGVTIQPSVFTSISLETHFNPIKCKPSESFQNTHVQDDGVGDPTKPWVRHLKGKYSFYWVQAKIHKIYSSPHSLWS